MRAAPLIPAACLLAAVMAGQSGGRRAKEMPNNTFFNRVELQLINTPSSSLEVLRAATKGQRRTIPAGAVFPVDQARTWTRDVLQPAYRPDERAVFLPFEMEAGICDTVRGLWEEGGYEFEAAHTRYLMSLKVRRVNGSSSASASEDAETLARRLFVDGSKIRLVKSGEFNGLVCGEQKGPPLSDSWPHWLDAMRWWQRGGETGFITLRAAGQPTREVMSTNEDDNRKWF